jgi:uncharacterized protein
MPWHSDRPIITVLLVGSAGGGLAWLVGMPSPWLIGSMLATAIAALGSVTVELPAALRSGAFLLLAASMGSAVTPDTVRAMMHWPLSLVILALTVPLLIGLVQAYLTRAGGWGRDEAILAAVPGALSYAVAAAVEAGIDPRRVALSQTLRLFLVVTLLPFAFTPGSHGAPHNGPAIAASGIGDLALVLIACALAAAVAARFAVPAPTMIGGLIGSGALHVTGTVTTALPAGILVPALIVTGVAIGGRFAGTRWAELRSVLPHALAAIAIAVAVSAIGAVLAARAIDVPLGQAMLAFAPGGLEAAAVLAFSIGYDPTYVATHQLIRFIGIAVSLPFILRWLAPRLPS